MKSRTRMLAVLVVATIAQGGASGAAQQTAVPDDAVRPVLVELFTSEGCSSCPPADELLRKLAGKRTDAGQLIIVLSEHVTYWNQLGWIDPFSSETFTQRQEIYGERFHLDGVYTPQAVVNGERQMPGGDASAIVQAVEAQKPMNANSLHIVNVIAAAGVVSVTFSVTGPLPKEPSAFYAAVADDLDTSNVARGENGGRTLTHVAVARSLTRVGVYKPGEAVTISLPLTARKGDAAKRAQHVVVFAQAEGQGVVSSVASAVIEGGFPQTPNLADVH